MLKYLIGILVALLIAASAYTSPVYATSASLVRVTHIQAGGSAAALQELVAIYNNSPDEVDITNWCLKNKTGVSFACFKTPTVNQSAILYGYGFATAASTAYSAIDESFDFSTTYTPTNQSSGSIVGGSDTITLVDAEGTIVDSHSWSTGLMGGMWLLRRSMPQDTYLYSDTDSSDDWMVSVPQTPPYHSMFIREHEMVHIDICPNIEGFQEVLPSNMVVDATGMCVDIAIPFITPAPLQPLRITELLPNPAGSDIGKEYIELYNPNTFDINLREYQLLLGASYNHTSNFPDDAVIAAGQYKVLTNADIDFSLTNTGGGVRLQTTKGEVVDESPLYANAGDDKAWALVNGKWQYTAELTPGRENVASVAADKVSETNAAAEAKPCAANQYRHPETNRCRLLATTTSPQTPCKDDQYRSEETNRCRNIASTADGPTPCKEDQERNPETGRCRKVTKMTTADYGVLGTQSTQNNGNLVLWLTIIGLVLAVLGYTAWEWRFEIKKLFYTVRRFARIRK